MLSPEQHRDAQARTVSALEDAGIRLTEDEKQRIEVADFGLGELDRTGLQLFTYISTRRVCAKELVLFSGQTCPQHRHPPYEDQPGKEETFRCRTGSVLLYLDGEPTDKIKATLPKGREKTYTVFREISLGPGEQYTIPPNTWHWFQAGEQGAVVSEFSTENTDDIDVFVDPDIVRAPKVG